MFGITEPTGSHVPTLETAARACTGLVIEHGAGLYSTPLLARLGCRVLCVESVPAYGSLVVGSGTPVLESPIGEGGEFYFENLAAGAYPAHVIYEGATCALTLIVPPSATAFLNIGTLTCITTSPEATL